MKYLVLLFLLNFSACTEVKYQRCLDDVERLNVRSKELKKIVDSDQLDRRPLPTNKNDWAASKNCKKIWSSGSAEWLALRVRNRPAIVQLRRLPPQEKSLNLKDLVVRGFCFFRPLL